MFIKLPSFQPRFLLLLLLLLLLCYEFDENDVYQIFFYQLNNFYYGFLHFINEFIQHQNYYLYD